MYEGTITGIVKRLDELKKQSADIELEQKAQWKQFDDLADELGDKESSFNFVAGELDPPRKASRIYVKPAPALNPTKLQTALTEEQWKGITRQTRVFDVSLLEAAVAAGKIKPEDVEAAMEGGNSYYRHTGPTEPTAAELAELRSQKPVEQMDPVERELKSWDETPVGEPISREEKS